MFHSKGGEKGGVLMWFGVSDKQAKLTSIVNSVMQTARPLMSKFIGSLQTLYAGLVIVF